MKFDDWLFYLLIAAETHPQADRHIRNEAKAAKKNWKAGRPLEVENTGTDIKAMRIINRLISADRPAELLRNTLSEIDFKTGDKH